MKPKSTGWRSTNDHAHGHWRTIAEQLNEPGRPITMEMVKHALLHAMAEEGAYPYGDVVGTLVPLDWSYAPADVANAAVEYAHAFAAEHGLYLYEYFGGVACKTWDGSRAE